MTLCLPCSDQVCFCPPVPLCGEFIRWVRWRCQLVNPTLHEIRRSQIREVNEKWSSWECRSFGAAWKASGVYKLLDIRFHSEFQHCAASCCVDQTLGLCWIQELFQAETTACTQINLRSKCLYCSIFVQFKSKWFKTQLQMFEMLGTERILFQTETLSERFCATRRQISPRSCQKPACAQCKRKRELSPELYENNLGQRVCVCSFPAALVWLSMKTTSLLLVACTLGCISSRPVRVYNKGKFLNTGHAVSFRSYQNLQWVHSKNKRETSHCNPDSTCIVLCMFRRLQHEDSAPGRLDIVV